MFLTVHILEFGDLLIWLISILMRILGISRPFLSHVILLCRHVIVSWLIRGCKWKHGGFTEPVACTGVYKGE